MGPTKLADGSTYTGDWLNGKMHGQGVLVQPDGAVYEGQF